MDNTYQAAIRVGDWNLAAELLEPMLGDEVDPVIRAVAITDAIALAVPRDEPTDELMAALEALPDREGDIVKGTAIWFARGVIAYGAGQFELARQSIRKAGDLHSQAEAETNLFAARSSLHLGDAAAAAADLARVDASPRRGRAIDTDRLIIRAGIAALEGRPAEALAGYRQALGTWRDLGLAWDEALLAIDMATFLDPAEPEVRAAADAAHEILIGLRATAFIDRLDAALSRTYSRPAAVGQRPRESSTQASAI
jgi:tetratricopeptide (TPR) repeat protein